MDVEWQLDAFDAEMRSISPGYSPRSLCNSPISVVGSDRRSSTATPSSPASPTISPETSRSTGPTRKEMSQASEPSSADQLPWRKPAMTPHSLDMMPMIVDVRNARESPSPSTKGRERENSGASAGTVESSVPTSTVSSNKACPGEIYAIQTETRTTLEQKQISNRQREDIQMQLTLLEHHNKRQELMNTTQCSEVQSPGNIRQDGTRPQSAMEQNTRARQSKQLQLMLAAQERQKKLQEPWKDAQNDCAAHPRLVSTMPSIIEGFQGPMCDGRPGEVLENEQEKNHRHQDYQMQLLLLEQENKRRVTARAAQINSTPHPSTPSNAVVENSGSVSAIGTQLPGVASIVGGAIFSNRSGGQPQMATSSGSHSLDTCRTHSGPLVSDQTPTQASQHLQLAPTKFSDAEVPNGMQNPTRWHPVQIVRGDASSGTSCTSKSVLCSGLAAPKSPTLAINSSPKPSANQPAERSMILEGKRAAEAALSDYDLQLHHLEAINRRRIAQARIEQRNSTNATRNTQDVPSPDSSESNRPGNALSAAESSFSKSQRLFSIAEVQLRSQLGLSLTLQEKELAKQGPQGNSGPGILRTEEQLRDDLFIEDIKCNLLALHARGDYHPAKNAVETKESQRDREPESAQTKNLTEITSPKSVEIEQANRRREDRDKRNEEPAALPHKSTYASPRIQQARPPPPPQAGPPSSTSWGRPANPPPPPPPLPTYRGPPSRPSGAPPPPPPPPAYRGPQSWTPGAPPPPPPPPRPANRGPPGWPPGVPPPPPPPGMWASGPPPRPAYSNANFIVPSAPASNKIIDITPIGISVKTFTSVDGQTSTTLTTNPNVEIVNEIEIVTKTVKRGSTVTTTTTTALIPSMGLGEEQKRGTRSVRGKGKGKERAVEIEDESDSEDDVSLVDD